MKTVGIIANPASGKDIRRLVAYGSVFDNHEKVNIVRRVLRALDSLGVREAVFMPDYFNIGARALEDLGVSLQISFLEMLMTGTQVDSMRAAAMMAEMGVGLIVTLGGDGTNRMVAKTCGELPLLPISTGTNNVFPLMIEGTLAGLAAAIVSMNTIPLEKISRRTPRLEIRRQSKLLDIALVDVVVSKSDFIATRAIWDVTTLKEIFLTRSEPGNIGFSSVGGLLCPLSPKAGKGLHIVIGPGQHMVKAPVAPGLISSLPILSYRLFGPREDLPLLPGGSTIALDGEREISLREGEEISIGISTQGPLVLDIQRVFAEASERGIFISPQIP